ncbi:tRNA nucleotidyltransferase (poly A polymerase head domain-containing protein) [Colletotrichum graminicola]|nr:tRNA nucleotidyltransferase (poly A polymerase head domain-containing protein) [Colletotrichum graminicola]
MLRETVEAWQEAASTRNALDSDKILPDQCTLANLAHDLPECESLPQCHVLEVLLLCLKTIKCTDRGSQDKGSIQQLASHAVELLGQSFSTLRSVDSPAVAEKALDVLKCLVIDFAAALDEKYLVYVAAYTDSQDTWTTPSAASSSEDILSNSLNNDTRHTFIASAVLEHFIRPVFSRTASNRITSTGRNAHFINDDKSQVTHDSVTETTESRPWKSTQVHAITVFAWAVKHASESLISKSWPLFTPVLLALIDDTETKFNKKGLVILHDFLSRCPPHLIGNTGLGEVFEQSVFPSLLSLPGVTPEDESLQLLGPAYNAIIELAKTWFPDGKSRPAKMKFLIKVLREGVLAGYWHASEYAGVVELLAKKSISIISQLGTSVHVLRHHD